MLKRLVVGLLKGFLIGALLALLLIKGLGAATFGGFLAYLTACIAGMLTGLIVGKPLWAKDAKIEAGLKGAVGAFIGAAALFALRKWIPVELDLLSLGAGSGQVGTLPAVSLPLITSFLGMVFEVDNTREALATDATTPIAAERKRIAGDGDAELADEAELEAEQEPSPPARRTR
jgi:hypothetical protein